jgi:AcrR family transcriptional regulator
MSKTLSQVLRQQILSAASSAFYSDGYHAIGVDELAQRAGVSKMTLYRYFPSKEDLIIGVLQAFNANSNALYAQLMASAGADTPRAKLLAVFEWIATRSASEACQGCAFQSGAAEYAVIEHPVHQAALANKRDTRAIYLNQAQLLGARDPEVLADQLLLLTDGAWAASRMWGSDNPSRSVVAAAATLIDAQIYFALPSVSHARTRSARMCPIASKIARLRSP